MITLHVGGQKVEWAEAEKFFAETAPKQPIEFRDPNGRVIATSVPGSEPVGWCDEPIPPAPNQPRPHGPAYTLEEWRRMLGEDW
jgi:hypothetical protein